jgi:hypothetical protein
MATPNHATQTDPYLHEPKNCSTATSGQSYHANGSGSGTWKKEDYSTVSAGFAVQSVYSSSGTCTTGATIVPFDNTIPQNTEGLEVLTVNITPNSATNVLEIEAEIVSSFSASAHVIAALFQDTTADALAVVVDTAGADELVTQRIRHHMVAGTSSLTTFKVRAGGSATGTYTFNGTGGTGLFGGVCASNINVKEIVG